MLNSIFIEVYSELTERMEAAIAHLINLNTTLSVNSKCSSKYLNLMRFFSSGINSKFVKCYQRIFRRVTLYTATRHRNSQYIGKRKRIARITYNVSTPMSACTASLHAIQFEITKARNSTLRSLHSDIRL